MGTPSEPTYTCKSLSLGGTHEDKCFGGSLEFQTRQKGKEMFFNVGMEHVLHH